LQRYSEAGPDMKETGPAGNNLPNMYRDRKRAQSKECGEECPPASPGLGETIYRERGYRMNT